MGRTRKRGKDRKHRVAPMAVAEPARERPETNWRLWFWVGVTGAALLLRIILLPYSPKITYPGDHDDFVRWAVQATDEGVLTLYDHAPPRRNMQVWNKGRARWFIRQREFDRVCNYPPASTYLLYASGLAFKVFSDDRLINTVTSHVLFSFWSIVCDFITAWGCAAIVSLFRRPMLADLTYALVLFLPPLWWDSVVWGQMDAVVLAPTVWMLYFMLRSRWLLAGVLWGLAFGLKPQAILFIPLWGLAVLIARPRWRPWTGIGAAAVALFVIALPFTLHSGWAWWNISYWENIFSSEGEYSVLTTLKAFNLWFADLLITDSLDAKATWFGITKNAWGKVFLLVALLASFALVLWRWRNDRRALALFAGVSLLAFMIFPTQVHERYLVLALPFMALLAALWGRFWPALLLLTIVAMGQITWPQWMGTKAGDWPRIVEWLEREHAQAQARQPPGVTLDPLEVWKQRRLYQYRVERAKTLGYEWTFTIFALLGTVLSAAALIDLRAGPGDVFASPSGASGRQGGASTGPTPAQP